MKTTIVIGGSEQFTDEELGLTQLDALIKASKIDKKGLKVYGYSPKNVGAFAVAKKWATNNKLEFLNGNPKPTNGDWKVSLEERNQRLADECDVLFNLRVGNETGGNTIIKAFADKNKPVLVIDQLPAPPQKAGVQPDEELLKRNIAIYSEVARKLLNYGCLMLDTETTGLTKEDEVIEIAMADCKTGVTVFNSLIYSDKPSNEYAAKVHKITPEMLEGSPTIGDVWEQIEAIVGNRVLLASNCSFDERLLNQSLAKHGLTCSFIWQDIQTLYRAYSLQGDAKKFPLKTEGMCRQLGIVPGTHRAKDDVLAQIAILQAMANNVVPNFEA